MPGRCHWLTKRLPSWPLAPPGGVAQDVARTQLGRFQIPAPPPSSSLRVVEGVGSRVGGEGREQTRGLFAHDLISCHQGGASASVLQMEK